VGGIIDVLFGGGGDDDEGPIYQPAPEDPSIKARQEAEEERARQDRIRAQQEELSEATKARRRGLGVRSLYGTPTRSGASRLGAG
jgi:hypothetical protein